MSDKMDAIWARLRDDADALWDDGHTKTAADICALLAENERLTKETRNLAACDNCRQEVARLTAEVEALRLTELPQGWMAAPRADWDKLTAEVAEAKKENERLQADNLKSQRRRAKSKGWRERMRSAIKVRDAALARETVANERAEKLTSKLTAMVGALQDLHVELQDRCAKDKPHDHQSLRMIRSYLVKLDAIHAEALRPAAAPEEPRG